MVRKIPGVLWISIVAMGAATLIQLIMGVQKGSGVLLVAVVLNVALIAGLLLGQKWAYVTILVLVTLGLIVALSKNAEYLIGMLIGNGLVVVPMIMSTRFFFPEQQVNPEAEKPAT